jgi:hypothetical protein
MRRPPTTPGGGGAPPPPPPAPDLLDLVPHRVSSNSPRIWELPHVASTPPTSSPTPAAAPSSNPDRTSLTRWCAHRRAGHHRAVHRPVGRHPRARACGPAPARPGSTPTRVPGRHSHPRAGVAGDRIRLARRRAATGWQFTQLGARPCAHPVAGMRVKPAHRLPRPPPPAPAAQRRSGRLPTATPANHPLVRAAPAVRPGTGGAKPPTLSAARWCISQQR